MEFDTEQEGLLVTGCPAAYATAENLAVRAWRAVETRVGAWRSGLRVRIQANIPPTRGLGSSAALLAAGAAAANLACGEPFTRAELLDLIAEMEGHPDNVAPAMLGGLQASMPVGREVRTAEYPVHPSLGFCALVPDFEVSTKRARQALPHTIPQRDAAYNLAHLALTLRALGDGDAALLSEAMDDRLHQPWRLGLIPGYDHMVSLAKDMGCAAVCISGSGPTLLCVMDAARVKTFAMDMAWCLADDPHAWRALPLEVDRKGVCEAEDTQRA